MITTTEPRWDDLADHLVRRLAVGDGTRLSVFVNDGSAIPAAHALIAAATGRGAVVQTVYVSEFADAIALRHGSLRSLAEPPPLERAALEWSEVHVSFRAMLWPGPDARPAEADLPARLAAQRVAKGLISTSRWQETRWAIVRVPTPTWAEAIGVDPARLLDEFFAGALGDWESLRERWQPLATALSASSEVTITSPDTHLVLGTAGRRGVLFCGEANLPDGELATAPVDDEVDGHITFPGTTVFAGQLFEDLRLEFEAGEVSGVRASRGQALAEALVATDAGSRRVGELGIGLSAAIRQWTGDLFIDEKILGTVHIALGRAYPECHGTNASSLHWDIVKDLRRGARGGAGSLVVDDLPVIESGRVVWPGLDR